MVHYKSTTWLATSRPNAQSLGVKKKKKSWENNREKIKNVIIYIVIN